MIGDLLIVAAIGIAALVVAELVARAWLARRGRYFVWPPHQRMLLELDPEALPDLPPRARLEFNADGERGDPLPDDWSGTYRALVAGGSAAECYFLDQDRTWPAALQRELGEAARDGRMPERRAHVGNVARSLAPCETLHGMLARTLPRYERLDLIVFMVGASDVVAWLEEGTPPALEDGRLPLLPAFGEHPEGPFSWSPSGLALRRLASRAWRRIANRVDVRPRAGKRLVEFREMRARAREVLDSVPDPEPLVDYFGRHFRSLLELARTHSDRVLVVRQPWLDRRFSPEEARRLWNFGRGRPYREEVSTYYSHRVVGELMRAVDATAVEICAELGIEELDLMPVVDASFDHFYDFLHFTAAGSEVVAGAIAARVLGDPDEAHEAADPQPAVSLKSVERGSR